MISAQPSSDNPTTLQELTAANQASFFETLKRNRFSGRVVLASPNPRGEQWTIYLYLGRILYANGGKHRVRRWKRNVVAYLPEIASQLPSWMEELADLNPANASLGWEYQLLCLWVDRQAISRQQAASSIRSAILEVLFDVTQTVAVTGDLKPENLSCTALVLLDPERTIGEVQALWQAWQEAKIGDRSPNGAPAIKHPELLQQRTAPQTYQVLSQLLDGKQSLRDLAVRMKRDVLAVTRSLLPYLQLGLVELTAIPDLPPPQKIPEAPLPVPSGPLIACIDDSPLVCQTLEKILTAANYQFVSVSDPLRAIATVLARKPALIFLDLVMPNANGYEICSQLRKLSFFRDTPIVILTGNDGLIDRVRAKMVGSTDFLSKPIEPELVLSAIRRYLPQEVPA